MRNRFYETFNRLVLALRELEDFIKISPDFALSKLPYFYSDYSLGAWYSFVSITTNGILTSDSKPRIMHLTEVSTFCIK